MACKLFNVTVLSMLYAFFVSSSFDDIGLIM